MLIRQHAVGLNFSASTQEFEWPSRRDQSDHFGADSPTRWKNERILRFVFDLWQRTAGPFIGCHSYLQNSGFGREIARSSSQTTGFGWKLVMLFPNSFSNAFERTGSLCAPADPLKMKKKVFGGAMNDDGASL